MFIFYTKTLRVFYIIKYELIIIFNKFQQLWSLGVGFFVGVWYGRFLKFVFSFMGYDFVVKHPCGGHLSEN